MAEDEQKQDGGPADASQAKLIELLTEIRDIQRESLDRQNRFLWVSIPIFAVLCVQATLLLFR